MGRYLLVLRISITRLKFNLILIVVVFHLVKVTKINNIIKLKNSFT